MPSGAAEPRAMAIDRAGKGTGGAISAWDERRRDRKITKRSSTKRVLPVAGAVTIRVARRASVRVCDLRQAPEFECEMERKLRSGRSGPRSTRSLEMSEVLGVMRGVVLPEFPERGSGGDKETQKMQLASGGR